VTTRRDPQTRAEWQAAVDAAAFWLLIDDARLYGLVTGPVVDRERCFDLIARGRAFGVEPCEPVDAAQVLVRDARS
jgi:hypothetical protein